MKIDIVTKNFTLNDHLKDVVSKKLMKLDKYFEEDTQLKLILQEVHGIKAIMEVKIFLDQGRIIRATAIGKNMYDNIDVVIPKIEGQVRKLRSSKIKQIKKSGIDELLKMQDVEKLDPVLKRVKTLQLKKMSVEEAISEMELLDRTFFLFVSDQTGMVNVVYKRNDGDIGLIDLIY